MITPMYGDEKETGGIVIRVYTHAGATVTCTNGARTQTKTSFGSVVFSVSNGTWKVSSTYKEKMREKTVDIDGPNIYDVDLKGTTYGISIDMKVDDPEEAVTYIDEAKGMEPLSCDLSTGACDNGSWQMIISDWLGCKPCLYNNGKRVAYLNPSNYSKKLDGTSADISTGGAGDVMVEFASRWYKFSSPSTDTLTFEVADYDRTADGFIKAAFLSEDGNATDEEFFYYGVYDGYVEDGKLRSLSGKVPTTKISYNDSIRMAAKNNSSCTIESLFKRMYILGLLMLVTKSRGIQDKIGHGLVDSTGAISTGSMNDKGLFYGRDDETMGVKCFGIEHMWGNLFTWMAGFVSKNGDGISLVKSCAPYSPDGSGYEEFDTGVGARGGYPVAYGEFAFGAIILPTDIQEDAKIGWPDYFFVSEVGAQVALIGGDWSNGVDYDGPFYAYIGFSPSDVDADFGARLIGT